MNRAQEGRARRDYWEFIAKLPCVVCYDKFYIWLMKQDAAVYVELLSMVQQLAEKAGSIQRSRTEVAHMGRTTSRRGMAQKYPWVEVWPLCGGHHRECSESHHAGTATFWQKCPQLDRDGIINLLIAVHAAKPVEVTI